MVDREDIHTGGMHRYVPSIYTDTEIPCVMYGDGTRMEILNQMLDDTDADTDTFTPYLWR